MIRRPFIQLISILFLIVLWSGCTTSLTTDSPKAIDLKLNWEHSVQFLGFYVAQDLGFYADEGLQVSIEPLGDVDKISEIPAQVAAGEFDFSLGSGLIKDAQAERVPLTVIAAQFQFSPLTYFAQADSGIHTPADLAGHRVAVKGEDGQILLERLLKTVNLTLNDVEIVPVGFDMAPFYAGEVDVWVGYITNEVVRVRQQGLEIVTLPFYEYGIHDVPITIYTREKMVTDDPDLVVRFLQASLRGWEWALDHPTEAVDIMLTRFPELGADREFHLASFDAYLPLVRPPGARVGTIDCQRWVSDELFANLDNTKTLCTTSMLEAVWKEE